MNIEVLTALAGLATGIGASSITTWLLNRYDRRHPAVDVDKLVERIEALNRKIDLSTLADKLDALNNAVIELSYLRIRFRGPRGDSDPAQLAVYNPQLELADTYDNRGTTPAYFNGDTYA